MASSDDLKKPESSDDLKKPQISPDSESFTSAPTLEQARLNDDKLGSYEPHVFSDPKVADYWREVYERAGYENRHRFDPSFTWNADEERRLVRTLDFKIMAWVWLMFCSLDYDRKNVNRAVSDNMLPELHMNTNDFNTGNTIFLVSFLAAELPSGLISKKLGADRWVPFLICAWSVISASQAFMQTKTQFFAIRCLFGLFQGGFIPDMVLYLTYFYKSNELPIRLSYFWTALSVCSIVGSLCAAGFLKMRGLEGWSGWRWLFLLEGLITLLIGLWSIVWMPPSPCQTASVVRGKKGWFTEREELILVNRVLRDDPSKGDMNNRQGVGVSQLWKSFLDFDLWPLYIIGFMAYIPPGPPTTYLNLILRNLGFSVFVSNVLSIPSQVWFLINLLILTWVSRRVKERTWISSISQWWMLPFFIALVTLPEHASPWVRYALLTGVLSYPYCHAILVGWTSSLSNTVRTRAVAAALYNMFVQAGNVVSANIYRNDDAPYYYRGNKILLYITVANLAIFALTKAYYKRRNVQKEAAWNALTTEEKLNYLATTKDEGSKRLDFRFVH